MNKEELINLIEKLEMPKDEYYILSSGSLALYNLRDRVGDLDLCISKELFEVFKQKYGIKEENKNACGFYKINDLVECVVEDKKDFIRDFREGYPVEKLEKVLEFKKKMNRAKDINDIKNIEEFLSLGLEKRDLYDNNHNVTNCTIYKGDVIPEGYFIDVVIIVMKNKENKFLIQKRSKEKNGLWAFTGGHTKEGQTSLEGILDEVREEIGLDISNERIELFDCMKNERFFFNRYYVNMEFDISKIKLQKEEVEDYKIASKDEIEEIVNAGKFFESNEQVFRKYLEYMEIYKNNINNL